MCHIPYWFKIMQSVSLQHVVGLSVRNAKGFPVEQANLALNQLQNKVQTSKWRNTMKKIVALTVNQCKIRGKITSLDSKKISACYITYNRSIANYTVLHIRQKYNIKHKHKRKPCWKISKEYRQWRTRTPDLLFSGQVPYQLGQLALADKRQFEPALSV